MSCERNSRLWLPPPPRDCVARHLPRKRVRRVVGAHELRDEREPQRAVYDLLTLDGYVMFPPK